MREKKKIYDVIKICTSEPLWSSALQADAYPIDLDVVQLLLPLQDVLHSVYPDVDVPHQHRLAHVLNEPTQRDIQGLQQLFDGADVLLVIEDCGELVNSQD